MNVQDDPRQRPVRSYVLRAGRMTEAQRRALDKVSDIVLPSEGGILDFTAIFGRAESVFAEIGFGMGEATVKMAENRPDANFLGIEVHRPGIAKLVMETRKRALTNLRIIEGDAVEIISRRIPPSSLSGVHLFFPDPWPKKRHNKRRIVKGEFLETLRERLVPGTGYFHMATDWEAYAEEALICLSASPGFANPFGGFAPRPSWRPETKFELRGIKEGRKIFDLHFLRSDEEV